MLIHLAMKRKRRVKEKEKERERISDTLMHDTAVEITHAVVGII